VTARGTQSMWRIAWSFYAGAVGSWVIVTPSQVRLRACGPAGLHHVRTGRPPACGQQHGVDHANCGQHSVAQACGVELLLLLLLLLLLRVLPSVRFVRRHRGGGVLRAVLRHPHPHDR
jgi:hypothetical protein